MVIEIPKGKMERVLTVKKRRYKSVEMVVNRNTPSPLQLTLKAKKTARPTIRVDRKKPTKKIVPKAKPKEEKIQAW